MMPAPGDLIAGKYRVDRKLAEGGMGVIYEGLHVQLDQRVAIKFLRDDIPALAQADAVQRFLREARASTKIRSEHVVRVLDVSATEGGEGVPYMVMELLEGQDLDQRLERGGALPPMEAVDFVLQACEALAEAHQRGIIHRDLKPANLFLTQRADGSSCLKLLDFGISKLSGAGADLGITSTQAVMGSPRYMSPEQLRTSKGVDVRTDIWALGVVLYELLVGQPPFDGESMTEVIAAILTDVPSLAGREGIPAGLEAVILCALEKSPSDRFASIGELAAALRPFASAQGAASAARASGTTRIQYSSDPSLIVAAPLSEPLAPTEPVFAAPAPAPSGMTSTSWGDLAPKPRKRGIAAIAAVVVGALCIASGAVYVRRDHNATPPVVSAPLGAPAHVDTPPTAESVATATAVEALPAAPDSAPAPSTSVATPAKHPTSHGGPAQHSAPSAAPVVTAPAAPAPAPAPTQLWNGRK